MESTGKRIKQALQLRKMKQTELASLLNVSRGTVSNYIADRYSPYGNAHGRTIFYEVWLIAAYQKTPR